MNQVQTDSKSHTLFSCGLELAALLVASDIFDCSWEAIWNLYNQVDSYHGCDLNEPITTPSSPFSVRHRIYQKPKYTIIAFACSSSPSSSSSKHRQQPAGGGEGAVVPSAILQENNLFFSFLATKDNSSISINEEAITLFLSLFDHLSRLPQQFGTTPLIITGHSVGGSVASLFTLWLLQNLPASTSNLPLCITFGSPLVGDNGLRQAILSRLTWHSRFLHVVSDHDFIPRLFISPNTAINTVAASSTSPYKPFGTFLLCSKSGCACFEDPDSILELMAATGGNPSSKGVDYGEVLEHLKDRMLYSRGVSQPCRSSQSSLRAGIGLQLEAIGVGRVQEKNQGDTLIKAMEKWERTNHINHRRHSFDRKKKLNEIKKNMALLEWYKKVCSTEDIGYYDCYKSKQSQRDMDVIKYKKILTNYWEDMVREAERKPQKQGIPFQISSLYAGTNYRRMVEPLDIADYYKVPGQKDYKKNGRPNHYIMLEIWLEQERAAGDQKDEEIRNKATNQRLTVDSCFWAEVEEAIILTKSLKNGEESSREKLKKFESYVMGLIDSYAVSPEIFLKKSSFMQWWTDYKMIQENAYSSPLTNFMKNHSYRQYA